MSKTVTQPTLAIRTKSEPLATKYTVMFDRDIEESNSFHEEFYVMEQATQHDVVDVCISSFGGSVATISKFQDVVKNSPANFHGKLHGYGYSAGGALFLLCHTQEVSDLATFMAHSIQTGYSGGTQAIEAHSKMSSKQNEALCRLLYQDFLTEEEIIRVIDGAEIWMEANEIRERLSNRDQIREQRLIEESKETYTPEFYSRSVFADILEDCTQFDYSLDEILKMVKGYSDELSEEESEEDDVFKVLNKEYVESVDDIDELKAIANNLLIQYNYNISSGKLKKRILACLEETEE